VSKNGTRVHGLSIRRVFTSATSIHGSVPCVPTEVSGNAVMPSHSHEVIPVPINIKFHSGPVRILGPVTSGNSRKLLSSMCRLPSDGSMVSMGVQTSALLFRCPF